MTDKETGNGEGAENPFGGFAIDFSEGGVTPLGAEPIAIDAAPPVDSIAPDGGAVLVEDPVLARDRLGRPEHVARIAVLRHEPQRLLLAAAADHDRDARPRQRLRGVE